MILKESRGKYPKPSLLKTMTTSVSPADRFPSVRKTFIKSKLLIITAVATIIACNGLPVYSSPGRVDPATELANKQRLIGFIAAGQCFVNTSKSTQEAVDEMTRGLLNERPYLEPAYAWATTSRNGRAAVEAMVPYMNDACDDIALSNEQLVEVLTPYFM